MEEIKSEFKKRKNQKYKILSFAIIVIFAIIILSVVLFLTCSNNQSFYNRLEKMGFRDLGEQFICNDIESNSNLLMSTRKYSFIAIEGEVYNIAFDRLFDNNQNCEKRDFETKLVSHIDDVVVGENAKFYSVYEDLLLREDITFDYDTKDIIQKSFQFLLKKDGNIYYQENEEGSNFKIKYKKDDFEGKIQSIGLINSDYTENEERKIIVITDKAIYYTKADNKEKCKQFADIKCNYKMVKDDFLSKNIKKILYLDDSILITKDGKVLYTNNYFDK